jgi:chaperonin GroEL
MELAEDPLILIHDKKISNMKELLPVLGKMHRWVRVTVIAEDLEGELHNHGGE